MLAVVITMSITSWISFSAERFKVGKRQLLFPFDKFDHKEKILKNKPKHFSGPRSSPKSAYPLHHV